MPVNQLDREIGERLTELVNKHYNKKSRQFAIKFGIDPSLFLKIQKGERGITLEKLVDISSEHGVSIEWLITGHEKSGNMPDSIASKVEEELNAMRSSLDKLSKTFAKMRGSDKLVGDPPKPIDLSLDKNYPEKKLKR